MPSAVVKRFEYSAERRELLIEFVTGRRYLYMEVPQEVALDFRFAFAKGSFFNRRIRDAYPCRELAPE